MRVRWAGGGAAMGVGWSPDTSTSGGSSETDVNAFAVIACTSPPRAVVTTVTPVVSRPSVRRIAPDSMRWTMTFIGGAALAAVPRAAAPHEAADVAVVDHVGD